MPLSLQPDEEPTEELEYTPVTPVLLRGGHDRRHDAEDRGNMDLWRLFIAIELPSDVRSELVTMGRRMVPPRRDDRRPSRGWRDRGGPRDRGRGDRFQRGRNESGRYGNDRDRYRGGTRDAVPSLFGQVISLTAGENLHVTLKFLGDTPREQVGDVENAIRDVASDSGVMNVELGENGCFPGERTPRILWTGLRGDVRRMFGLVAMLDGALERRGVDLEELDFFPHITVARVRGGTSRRVLAEIGQRWIGLKADPSNSSIRVNRISLIRSHFRLNKPPRYEHLCRVSLG